MSMMVQGTCTAHVTRQMPAIQGTAAGTPNAEANAPEQLLIGAFPAQPSFIRYGNSSVADAGRRWSTSSNPEQRSK